MHSGVWTVLHIVVHFAEWYDTIVPLRRATSPVGITDNVVHIDEPRAAHQARDLLDPA